MSERGGREIGRVAQGAWRGGSRLCATRSAGVGWGEGERAEPLGAAESLLQSHQLLLSQVAEQLPVIEWGKYERGRREL